MLIQELTGILTVFGLALLRFGIPAVLTWVFGSLLRRAVSSHEQTGA